MLKIENSILQNFIDNLIETFKCEKIYYEELTNSKLDIPFIISSLHHSFKNNESAYSDFICDLVKYPDYNISLYKSQNDWNGIIDAKVSLVKYDRDDFSDYDIPEYNYEIEFSFENRDWGYCQCTPDTPDYREDKGCCGHGCDATFSKFALYKVTKIAKDSWHGDEHDYWDFEDEFYKQEEELAKQKAKEELENQIRILKSRIAEDTKTLSELNSKVCEVM